MSNDPLIAGAMRRGQELQVQTRRVEALLAEYQADDNEYGVSEAIGELAKLQAEGRALNELHADHIRRTTPQYQEPEGGLEWMGKPAHKMTGNDGLSIANYGKSPGDPTWLSADEYNQQLARLNRAKANGEYT